MTAHVPLPFADKIDAVAARLDRSRDWIVREALAAWLDLEEERHRLTLQALADVDAGHTVSQAQMEAWADSLGTDKPAPLPAS